MPGRVGLVAPPSVFGVGQEDVPGEDGDLVGRGAEKFRSGRQNLDGFHECENSEEQQQRERARHEMLETGPSVDCCTPE